MRLQDIFEMAPEIRDWTKDQTSWIKDSGTYISFTAVARLYDSLNVVIERQGQAIYFFLNKKRHNCIAVVKDYKPITNKHVFRIISSVSFHQPKPLSKLPSDILNPLQVRQVFTDPVFENQGIAAYIYALLVKEGFTIISDRVQYLGGKELWKKMAREAHLLDYSIYIHNDDTGYIKNQEGGILKYDASNIDDSIIWKSSTIGQKTVLILSAH